MREDYVWPVGATAVDWTVGGNVWTDPSVLLAVAVGIRRKDG